MAKDFNFPNWVDQDKLDEIVTTLRKAAMIPVNTIGRALSTPNLDLWEEEDKYIAYIEIPGYSRNEIDLTVKDGMLTISSNKAGDEAGCENPDKNYLIQERRCEGSFRRTINFPKAVKADEIKAKYESGLLMVEIPKKERSEGVKVSID